MNNTLSEAMKAATLAESSNIQGHREKDESTLADAMKSSGVSQPNIVSDNVTSAPLRRQMTQRQYNQVQKLQQKMVADAQARGSVTKGADVANFYALKKLGQQNNRIEKRPNGGTRIVAGHIGKPELKKQYEAETLVPIDEQRWSSIQKAMDASNPSNSHNLLRDQLHQHASKYDTAYRNLDTIGKGKRIDQYLEQMGMPTSDKIAESNIRKDQIQKRGIWGDVSSGFVRSGHQFGTGAWGLVSPDEANARSEWLQKNLGQSNTFSEGVGSTAYNLAKATGYLNPATALPTIAADSSSVAGSKRMEAQNLREQGYEVSGWNELTSAAGGAATEFVAGLVMRGIVKGSSAVTKPLASKLPAAIASKNPRVVADVLKKAVPAFATRAGIVGTSEGAEEGLTQIAQNMIDMHTGLKREGSIYDGVSESAWEGFKIGGALGVLGGAADANSRTIVSKAHEYTEPMLVQRIKEIKGEKGGIKLTPQLLEDAAEEIRYEVNAGGNAGVVIDKTLNKYAQMAIEGKTPLTKTREAQSTESELTEVKTYQTNIQNATGDKSISLKHVKPQGRRFKLANLGAHKLGKKILFIESSLGADNPLPASMGTDKNTILIDVNAKSPMTSLVSHEYVHSLRKSDPKSYNEIVSNLKQVSPDLLDQSAQQYLRDLNAATDGHLDLSKDAQTEEGVAYLFEHMADKTEFWQNLRRQNESAFHKLAAKIRELISRLANNGVVNDRLSLIDQTIAAAEQQQRDVETQAKDLSEQSQARIQNGQGSLADEVVVQVVAMDQKIRELRGKEYDEAISGSERSELAELVAERQRLVKLSEGTDEATDGVLRDATFGEDDLAPTQGELETEPQEGAGEGDDDEVSQSTTVSPKKVAEQSTRSADTQGVETPVENKKKRKKNKQKTKNKGQATKIEDFGEKIGGARKDYAQTLKSYINTNVASMDDEQIVKQAKLAKIFPAPDYHKLKKSGLSDQSLIAVKVLRESIGSAPQKYLSRKRDWLEAAQHKRDIAIQILDTNNPVEALKSLTMSAHHIFKFTERVKYLSAMNFPDMPTGAGGYRIGGSDGRYWVAKGKSYIGGDHKTYQEAVDAIKTTLAVTPTSVRGTKFDVYRLRNHQDKKYIVGKKIKSQNYIDLVDGFATASEARTYIKEKQADLEDALASAKYIPPHRNQKNSERIGRDYRKGQDVSPTKFADTFGFRGVEFGNWVEGDRRQQDLNESYDALRDMATILNIPTKAISLNGELGLAFGSRGRNTKANAHYEASKVVINLTKTRGAGSLAHEWFHAVDNYFARMRKDPDSFITDDPKHRANYQTGEPDTSVRSEVLEAFNNVLKSIRSTEMVSRANSLDAKRTVPYWNTPIELGARAFESYVVYKNQQNQSHNDYLANVISEELYESPNSYPYLKTDEAKPVIEAFDNLFSTIKTKKTDKGVAMFAAARQRDPSKSNPKVPQNLLQRFDEDIPVIKLNKALFYKKRISKESKPKLKKWLMQRAKKLIHGNHKNKDTGWTINVSSAGIRHAISKGQKELSFELVRAIEPMIHNAILVESNHDASNRDTIKAFHHMYVPVQIGNDLHRVTLTIRETRDGHKYYDHDGIKIEPAHTSGIPKTPRSSKAGSKITIGQLLEKVKLDNGKAVINTNERQDKPKFAAAYHGSAHDFDAFTTQRIGTGEGAQAYGWGMYFAGNKKVAEWYKEKLARKSERQVAWDLESKASKLGVVISKISNGQFPRELELRAKSEMRRILRQASLDWTRGQSDTLNALKKQSRVSKNKMHLADSALLDANEHSHTLAAIEDLKIDGDFAAIDYLASKAAIQILEDGTLSLSGQGKLYQVDLKPEEHEYLSWDKPLSEQNETVKNALANIPPKIRKQINESLEYHDTPSLDEMLADNIYSGRDLYLALKHYDVHEALPPEVKGSSWAGGDTTYAKHTSLYLKSLGIRGIKFLDGASRKKGEGDSNYVIFDDADVEVTAKFAVAGETNYSSNGFDTPTPGRFEHFLYLTQDHLRPLKNLQAQIVKQKGKLDDTSNPYQKEELRRKKTQNHLQAIQNKYVDPILKVAKLYKIALPQIDEYLQARHAPERNRELSISHRKKDVYAGKQRSTGKLWTDEYAREYVQKIESSKKGAAYKKIARLHDQMNRETVELWRESGLVSEDVYDALNTKYEFYTPLKTDLEELADKPFSGIGMGIDIRGNEFKRAFGRKSAAGSSLTFAITSAQTAIIRAEKAKVGRTFYKLVKENPNPNLWSIDEKPSKLAFDEQGIITQVVDESHKYKDNVFAVKVDGKVHHITINNPEYHSVARALKNLDLEGQNEFIRGLGVANRFLASMSTRWNPFFAPVNMVRDVGSASLTLTGEKGIQQTAKVLAKTPFAMGAVWRGLRKGYTAQRNKKGYRDGNRKWDKIYKEYRDSGAPVAFIDLQSYETTKKEIDRDLKALDQSKLSPKKAPYLLYKVFQKYAHFTEDINEVFENAVRVAAYQHARESGMTQDQSASYAKNLTTNFERKGVYSPVISSLYMFANAQVQGNYRVVSSAKNHKGTRKVVASLVAAAALQDVINRAVAGEDEDGENYYDKIPEYTKRNYIILMLPFSEGQHIKIPSPFIYNLATTVGRNLNSSVYGTTSPIEGSVNMINSAFDTFNPTGTAENTLDTITPTVFRPWLQSAQNRNWTGNPIMPEGSAFAAYDNPDSQKYWRSVSPSLRNMMEMINYWTGGDEDESGLIDVSPETVEHYLKSWSGGAGASLMRIWNVGDKWYHGEPVGTYEMPLVRRFYGGNNPRYYRDRFYKWGEEIAREKERVEGKDKKKKIGWNHQRATAFARMQAEFNNIKKRVRKLKKDREGITDSEKKKTFDMRIDKMYILFNKKMVGLEKRFS
ncbi:hypothetical protein KS4_23500 [Poriferisphaera corsica]|uniref:Large polyvalent protein-associated domain-containing protein n=1 Tax=Poriferisphaera corsica TaxID=2528020 RepID=A0A517YVP5_9BACT|nr:LPD38 domain-containing protein [Poriferisphaera corsica]QDU34283.1 hypothetical protein KS4_23500 [Poriferisphaera corsica]